MNWTWNVRSNDGAMNGLEFARCTTAGGFGRVLIHAAPGDAAEHAAAHRAFRRVSVDAPALEVDTSDGYRPPFGQILRFVTGD